MFPRTELKLPNRSLQTHPQLKYCGSNKKRGSSVVRHLPLVLEVPGLIPAGGEKNFGARTRFLWCHLQG